MYSYDMMGVLGDIISGESPDHNACGADYAGTSGKTLRCAAWVQKGLELLWVKKHYQYKPVSTHPGFRGGGGGGLCRWMDGERVPVKQQQPNHGVFRHDTLGALLRKLEVRIGRRQPTTTKPNKFRAHQCDEV